MWRSFSVKGKGYPYFTDEGEQTLWGRLTIQWGETPGGAGLEEGNVLSGPARVRDS
jgi:hypothetical protein